MQAAQTLRAHPPEPLTRRCVAGVEVELLGAPPELVAGLRLPGSAALSDRPAPSRISCVVRAFPEALDPPEDHRARWRWTGDSCDVAYLGCEARLRALSPTRYAASLAVRGGVTELEALLGALAVATVYRRGGVVLHAAGVELDGRAVLFVGPSGAGKTTACSLTAGARGFVRDRAVLVPDRKGWAAWALPGWAPIDQGLEPSSAHRLPVAAILAVDQGDTEVVVQRCTAIEAARVLRESTMTGDASREGELALLDVLAGLARDVPCGSVTTVLGRPCGGALRDWLERGAP